jgi:hypothetical protein
LGTIGFIDIVLWVPLPLSKNLRGVIVGVALVVALAVTCIPLGREGVALILVELLL